MSRFIAYETREAAYAAVSETLAEVIALDLTKQNFVTVSVPGGTTPGPIFDRLSACDLAWDRVRIILGDERWVPDTHPHSNAKLLRERLLVNRAARAKFVPLYVEEPTPEEGISAVRDRIDAVLPLNVLLLGMGEDMHTASLFPEGDNLAEALAPEAPSVLTMRAEATYEARITLSASALNSATHKHVIMFGEAKKQAFEASKSLPPITAPIRAVMENLTVHWSA